MAKRIPLAEARAGCGAILDDLLAGGEPVALTEGERPVVVMLSFDDYDALVGALQHLSQDWQAP